MGRGEAFSLPDGRGGAPTTSERPRRVANRLRTRDREIVVTALRADDDASPSGLALVDANGGMIVEVAPDGGHWVDVSPVVLSPDTTFYLLADLPARGCFVESVGVAQAHPLLVDLGTWIGDPDWRPAGGPRIYIAHLRFEIGRSRRPARRADEILALAAKGLTDKAIAECLNIGVSTIETHWRLLRERGGFASRTEAVADFMGKRAQREREDLEAQRDRLATEAWLRERRTPDSAPARTVGVMRSWPLP